MKTCASYELKYPGFERGGEIAGLGWIKEKLAFELKTTTFHTIWVAHLLIVWEILLTYIWSSVHYNTILLEGAGLSENWQVIVNIMCPKIT